MASLRVQLLLAAAGAVCAGGGMLSSLSSLSRDVDVPLRGGGAASGSARGSGGVLSKLLLASTLDGRITALDANSGARLWSASLGGPMLRVQAAAGGDGESGGGNASGAGADAGGVPPLGSGSSLIIPSRDGGILVRTAAGMQQLPYRAQDLVAALPLTAGALPQARTTCASAAAN